MAVSLAPDDPEARLGGREEVTGAMKRPIGIKSNKHNFFKKNV